MQPKTTSEPMGQLNIFQRPIMEYSVGELVLHYKRKPVKENYNLQHTDGVGQFVRKVCIGLDKMEVKEYLYAIMLNQAGNVLGYIKMSEGTRNNTNLDFGHLVAAMICHNAIGCVLAHNHPSGNCTPSESDIELTKMLQKRLKVLGMVLHDHVVVTVHDCTSILGLRNRRGGRRATGG